MSKTIVITGASDGIGLLSREGIGLILAGGLLLFLNRKKRLA